MNEALKAIQDWCHLETKKDKLVDEKINNLGAIIENQSKIIEILSAKIDVIEQRVLNLEEKEKSDVVIGD